MEALCAFIIYFIMAIMPQLSNRITDPNTVTSSGSGILTMLILMTPIQTTDATAYCFTCRFYECAVKNESSQICLESRESVCGSYRYIEDIPAKNIKRGDVYSKGCVSGAIQNEVCEYKTMGRDEGGTLWIRCVCQGENCNPAGWTGAEQPLPPTTTLKPARKSTPNTKKPTSTPVTRRSSTTKTTSLVPTTKKTLEEATPKYFGEATTTTTQANEESVATHTLTQLMQKFESTTADPRLQLQLELEGTTDTATTPNFTVTGQPENTSEVEPEDIDKDLLTSTPMPVVSLPKPPTVNNTQEPESFGSTEETSQASTETTVTLPAETTSEVTYTTRWSNNTGISGQHFTNSTASEETNKGFTFGKVAYTLLGFFIVFVGAGLGVLSYRRYKATGSFQLG